MAIECKWQVILPDSGYSDFNMWMPLGGKIASRMFDMLQKNKSFCTED